MSYAIVMLDLKGYSDLTDDGKKAVFKEFFPFVKETATSGERAKGLVDANTWGDAVIAVFHNTLTAAQFALDIKTYLQRGETSSYLRSLKARIALHVGDLDKDTDAVRELAKPGSHMYGSEIVVPARLEPKVPPNAIWITERAASDIRGVLVGT